MKNNILYTTLALLFSAIFLIAGTGYNIVHFCCNDCEVAGIETVTETSCMSVHEHFCHDESTEHQHGEEAMACMHELNKGCDLKRLTVDVPSIQTPDYDFLDYSLLTAETGSVFAAMLSFEDFSQEVDISHSFPDIPIYEEGRQILSKISILRI